jgi:DNA-binding NarL/FixJ family response regulator
LTKLLTRQGIELVGEAADALDATVAIRKANPDVLVLDLHLLRGSGLSVLGTLKRDMPSLKIVVLTGYGGKASRQACARLGADFYMEKPDGFKALPQLLENLRQESAGPGAE